MVATCWGGHHASTSTLLPEALNSGAQQEPQHTVPVHVQHAAGVSGTAVQCMANASQSTRAYTENSVLAQPTAYRNVQHWGHLQSFWETAESVRDHLAPHVLITGQGAAAACAVGLQEQQ